MNEANLGAHSAIVARLEDELGVRVDSVALGDGVLASLTIPHLQDATVLLATYRQDLVRIRREQDLPRRASMAATAAHVQAVRTAVAQTRANLAYWTGSDPVP